MRSPASFRKVKTANIHKDTGNYKDLVMSAPVGIFTTTPEGKFCSVNPTMARFFGYDTPEQLIISVTSITDQIYVNPNDRLEFQHLMEEHDQVVDFQSRMLRWDGSVFWASIDSRAVRDEGGKITCYQGFMTDITARKQAEEAVQQRIVALTQPMEVASIAFEDLFNIDEIQRIQDDFAMAVGVASLITLPDGKPITRPSNFSYLCREFVRKSEKGRLKCMESDATIGRCNPDAPIVQECLSAGLCNAGASIMVSGHHIANWLIGQVRNENHTEEKIRAYARELGLDESSFVDAFLEVPSMPKERFEQIARALFTLANQLSTTAYQNLMQARFITERRKVEEALRESGQRFRSLVETTSDWVWEMDQEGVYTYSSPKIEDLLGYKPDEVIGKKPTDFFLPDEAIRLEPKLRDMMENPRPFSSLENVNLSKDGRKVVLESSGVPIFDRNGVFSGYRGIDRDITERRQAEEALRESEIRYQSIFENTGSAMLIVEEDMTISFVNSEFERMTGYRRRQIEGKKKWTEFVDPSDLRNMVHQHQLRRTDKDRANKSYEFRLVHRSGQIKDIYLLADIISGTKKTVAAMIDITERKRMEEALKESERKYRELSTVDDLSGLYNSRHFHEQLRMEMDRVNRYGVPLSLILLDIDDFKTYNDTYGHVEGDQVLMRLGRVIKRCLRNVDSAYRYGGEEFTILLPMTRGEDALAMAERIRTEFRKENLSPLPDKNIQMTVSMGVGQYHPKEDLKLFVTRVDQLMYRAKKDGKDGVCHE